MGRMAIGTSKTPTMASEDMPAVARDSDTDHDGPIPMGAGACWTGCACPEVCHWSGGGTTKDLREENSQGGGHAPYSTYSYCCLGSTLRYHCIQTFVCSRLYWSGRGGAPLREMADPAEPLRDLVFPLRFDVHVGEQSEQVGRQVFKVFPPSPQPMVAFL